MLGLEDDGGKEGKGRGDANEAGRLGRACSGVIGGKKSETGRER